MKSYLDLVPISAKVHRKQNRMSKLCIILAVFLVTAIFGMADMFIRGQQAQAYQTEGNWHAAFRDISDEDAEQIASRPEITAASWYGVLNYRGDMGYTLGGKNVIICGSDKSFLTDIFKDMITTGSFPEKENEALLTEHTRESMGLKAGDKFSIITPQGKPHTYRVTGFTKDTLKLMSEDSNGVYLNTKAFRSLYTQVEEGKQSNYNSVFYTRFFAHTRIQNAIADLSKEYGLTDEQVAQNVKVLGMMGQSREPLMLQIYGSAFALFLLVLLASVLMITSSLNSNIAQRTQFFGMMRCIGATSKQVMRLVRREALGWCKTAIPVGIALGVLVIWILCAMLRYLSPGYFGGMPVISISFPSVLSGICVGVLTVLLAARSPAKRASKVSPLTAVSGNADDAAPVRKAAHTRLYKVDTALGIHHAKASKRNFVLMVGSFSLSIILFLAFTVTVDFMNHALSPLKASAPDLFFVSKDNTCSISQDIQSQLKEEPAVKKVYGRMFAYDLPAKEGGRNVTVNLVSYEKNQFEWAKEDLLKGSVEEVQSNGNTGLLVYDQGNEAELGAVLELETKGQPYKIEVKGILSRTPFSMDSGGYTVICSEEVFRAITGERRYTILDLQLIDEATDRDVEEIRKIVGEKFTFSDRRMNNQESIGAYYSFALFVYGFLTFIALIAVFNIINSIAMSVSARMRQYGAMRAIGMSDRQLIKMIAAEAGLYALAGSIVGCVLGIPINRMLFEKLVTFRWGDEWQVPFAALAIILVIVFVASMAAIRGPAKRIRNMSIVDTISTN